MQVWGVWLDEAFYFSTDADSQKGRNIAANPNVALHPDTGTDEMVSLDGVAHPVADQELLNRVVAAYEAKYGYHLDPDLDNTEYRCYQLLPRVAFTWLESDIGGSITRWRFKQ
jgi:Pyridoxamine 5'-phosphate oxidase